MNKLTTEKRAEIVTLMVEGMSVRAICRTTGRSKGTVLRLLVDMGNVCRQYHDLLVRNVPSKRIQCDEVWSFNYCKEKNLPNSKVMPDMAGSVWTWTAICADTKLMVSWMVGLRDAVYANEFVQDLCDRLANRIQLTTDGLRLYLEAVEHAFRGYVDYAILNKLYAENVDTKTKAIGNEGIVKQNKVGDPDEDHISTSYVERSNLSLRMGLRRFTRLTNAHSKKFENHEAAINLFYFHYNFCRPHETLRGRTPAMAARLTDCIWSARNLVELLENEEQRQCDNN